MRTYAFIDGQNLHLGIEHQNWHLDLRRFRRYLSEKHSVVRAFYFLGYLARNESLYSGLRQSGFEVIFKPVTYGGGAPKGNCDAELVLHAMVHLSNYDGAVIVTGDGDFHCLAEYLESVGKLHAILIPDVTYFSALLKRFSKRLLFLNFLRHRLQFIK